MSYTKKNYEKYKKYLYFGAFGGVLGAVMLVFAVISTIKGDSIGVQISGYAAALMWFAASYLTARVYFAAKKADEERLDDNNKTI